MQIVECNLLTPAGPWQSLLLAKDPTSFWENLITLSVLAQTHLPKFLETSLDKVKERFDRS